MHLCSMLSFPHAKINLGLNVVARRSDGYHEVESVMTHIPVHDVLEMIIDEEAGEGCLEFQLFGIPLPESSEPNLCQRAHALFLKHRNLPAIKACLFKRIPIGAGLGGGSSDAAHMLQLLNQVADDPLPEHLLHEIASELGSDVPFFLNRTTQFAKGRGDKLEELPLDLRGLWGTVVNPGIHISTADAYSHTSPTNARSMFNRIVDLPLKNWDSVLFNSMEDHAIATYPEIGDIKSSLRASGAGFALMSGSGSTVFALFENKPGILQWPEHYSSWVFKF